jgi:hypothetical protein
MTKIPNLRKNILHSNRLHKCHNTSGINGSSKIQFKIMLKLKQNMIDVKLFILNYRITIIKYVKNAIFWYVGCEDHSWGEGELLLALAHSLLPAHLAFLPTYPTPLLSTYFPCGPLCFPQFLYSWMFSTGGSVCSHLLMLVPCSWILLPWRWRRYVPPKRRFMHDLHGATSQKTAFFIVTTVKTSNLTIRFVFSKYVNDTNCTYCITIIKLL